MEPVARPAPGDEPGFLPALLGMVLIRRHRGPWRLGVLLSAVMLFTMYAYLGDPRIHVPFDAYLIVLAVSAIARAFQPRA
jgi:hypothetical protein